MKKKRIIKSLTWNLIATAITAGITYMVTGSIKTTGAIVVIDRALKVVFYYFHEMIWDKK